MDALPVDRAAISTLGAPFDIETVSTSDDLAGKLSELQLDVGEGPGWEAHAHQAAVLIPDLTGVAPTRWPLFAHGASMLNVLAVYSLPLSIGALRIGAVDLYAEAANSFTPAALADATVLAGFAATDVLRHSLEHRHDEPEDDGPHSRREVHQATGMVIAQMRVDAADALLLIRAHAYASGRSVRETAADITARRITLQP
ncbi:ANTAR domain-containing protein [Herbiconiux sp. P17]|uniref:ANTAR domain-containing protein n=1 Tax=Herbiconiux wuyangfengii TaxID=3342794 RepID=UPI0035BAF8E8